MLMRQLSARVVASSVAVVFVLSGCSAPTATITGKVISGGRPVEGARISFLGKTGATFTGLAANDGTYTVENVPPAEYTVLVFGPPPPPKGEGAGMAKKRASAAQPEPVPGGPTVPAKYADAATSGLSFTAVAGANTYDPPLNP
jgi:hypothetical protein